MDYFYLIAGTSDTVYLTTRLGINLAWGREYRVIFSGVELNSDLLQSLLAGGDYSSLSDLRKSHKEAMIRTSSIVQLFHSMC